MEVFINGISLIADGKVIVTYISGNEIAYESEKVSVLYLNAEKIIDFRIEK